MIDVVFIALSLFLSVCYASSIVKYAKTTMDCATMSGYFGVVSGVTWGSLPARGQKRWRELQCDGNITEVLPPVLRPSGGNKFTEKDIRRMDCKQLKNAFGVQNGVSWGTLNAFGQNSWRELHCDAVLLSDARATVTGESVKPTGNAALGLGLDVNHAASRAPTVTPTFQPTIEHEYSPREGVNAIIAECDGGLANRVRVLVFYSYYAQWKYSGAELWMVWEVNDACPGHFLDLFEPVQGVKFITQAQADSILAAQGTESTSALTTATPGTGTGTGIGSGTVLRFRKSRDSVDVLVKRFITNIGQYRIWDIGLRKITLLPHIQRQVYDYLRLHDICNAYGIHVRRTDLHDGLDRMRQLTYPTIFKMITRLNVSNITLFLATDNAVTQAKFSHHYSTKEPGVVSTLLMYKRIDANAVASRLRATGVQPSSEFRHTDLETAVIDLYLLSYTKRFTRGLYSSFSEWVNWLRVTRGPEWRNEPSCPSAQHPQIK